MLAAGSDYTYPFFGVPHHHFLSTLYEYSQYFTEPMCSISKSDYRFVDFYLPASGSTKRYNIYKKILLFAYARAFRLKEDDFLPLFPITQDKLLKNYQQKVVKLIADKNKNSRKHFPSEQDLEYSASQLQYYLHLLVHLGDYNIPVTLDLRNYGYKSSDDPVDHGSRQTDGIESDDDNLPALTFDTIERMCIET